MLLTGLLEVGHEDVATGRGVFSLRSLNEALQHYGNPASAPSPSSHKDRHYGRSTLPACLSLMLVGPGQSPQHYSEYCSFFIAFF